MDEYDTIILIDNPDGEPERWEMSDYEIEGWRFLREQQEAAYERMVETWSN